MSSQPEGELGPLALVELLRRNAEAMANSSASNEGLKAELARTAEELRRVGDRLHDIEDLMADLAAVEKTRAESRKELGDVIKAAAKSPVMHAVAVAILGAVLNLLGFSWMAQQLVPQVLQHRGSALGVVPVGGGEEADSELPMGVR